MKTKLRSLWSRLRRSPYWLVIGVFWLLAAVLYGWHLATGRTPDPVIVRLSGLDLDIYWYGMIMVFGMVMGAWVASSLGGRRGEALMVEIVPAHVRQIPLKRLPFPEEIQAILLKNKIITLHDLLLQFGFDPLTTGLNKAGQATVRETLLARSDIDPIWLDTPPWRQWNPDIVWGGAAWYAIFGVIGARLYHVFTPSPSMAAIGITSAWDYFQQPLQLINLRAGGLGIFGGLIGGVIGAWIYTRRQRVVLLPWLDLATVSVSLGQTIGRWGNFVNQELYGRPTTVPWALTISPAHRLDATFSFATYHPAFLYESLWNFALFLLLYWLARHRTIRLRTGELTALYLSLYSLGRILMEFVRLDSATFSLGGWDSGLPTATVVAILTIILMAVWVGWQRRKVSPARPRK